jgi:putative tryptophan/tyrosine transport system substrate-binding protein
MDRRRFLLTSLAGALAAPLAAEAQQAGKMVRLGVISAAVGRNPIDEALEQALRELGWVKNRNVDIDIRPVFAKRLELLKEAVPGRTRVASLLSPDSSEQFEKYAPMMTAAAKALRLELFDVSLANAAEAGAAVRKAKDQGAQGLYIWPSGLTFSLGTQLSSLALEHGLPSIHSFTEGAISGGLLAYALNLSDVARRGAVYIDRILKGAKPADLPVEEPAKYELLINLKTAKALGLTIPPSLLARADQVIE